MKQSLLFVGMVAGALLFTLSLFAQVNAIRVYAQNGVVDLSKTDVVNQPVKLNGEWLIYPQQLLEPGDDFAKYKGYPVSFPSLWSNTEIEGKKLSSIGYATYTLSVILPKGTHADDLALDIPEAYSSLRLFVNAEDFFSLGMPGTTESTTIPLYKPGAKRLHFSGDTFRITLQIANFHHFRGGPYRSITLGNNDLLKNEREINRSYDLFLTGCLFMGGLFFVGLFIFGRHDKVILYFSLFCLSYAYRVIGSDEYTLHQLFPNYSWFVAIRLEYLSLYASITFLTLFNYHLYPREFSSVLKNIFVGFSLLCFAFTLFIGPIYYTSITNIYIAFIFIQLVYTIYVYLLGYNNKQPGALFSLLATAILFILFIVIILGFFTQYHASKFILLFTYIAFFFFQSLVLSYRFAFALRQASVDALLASKAKSEFLSTMSHEIRTPLNSIIGITSLLLQKKPEGEQKEYLDTMLFSANNLLYIINDILDFSKLEAGKMTISYKPALLGEIGRRVETTSKVLANEKGLSLFFVADPRLYKQPVLADPDRTTQVINNLIMNAIKFTTEGSVTLTMGLEEETEQNMLVKISIADTGIGIEKDKQELIFEEFTQVDSSINRGYAGTGLGLAICKEMLNMQGVELRLHSEPDKGSTFWFIQTFAKTEKLEQSVNSKLKEIDETILIGLFEGKNVLIAEDNPINMMVAEKVLNNIAPGLTIRKAVNGQEVLEAYFEDIPDIILMDVNMPVMDGLKAASQIRMLESNSGQKRIPIVAVTAGTLREDLERCKEAGMDTMIAKPYKMEELKLILVQMLSR